MPPSVIENFRRPRLAPHLIYPAYPPKYPSSATPGLSERDQTRLNLHLELKCAEERVAELKAQLEHADLEDALEHVLTQAQENDMPLSISGLPIAYMQVRESHSGERMEEELQQNLDQLLTEFHNAPDNSLAKDIAACAYFAGLASAANTYLQGGYQQRAKRLVADAMQQGIELILGSDGTYTWRMM